MSEDQKPFPCPKCGATDSWRAEYCQAVHQGVILIVGENGEPFPVDYRGDESSFDDGAGDNVRYWCENCTVEGTISGGYEIIVGEEHVLEPGELEALREVVVMTNDFLQNLPQSVIEAADLVKEAEAVAAALAKLLEEAESLAAEWERQKR